MSWGMGKDCGCFCDWVKSLWATPMPIPADSNILIRSEANGGCAKVALADLFVTEEIRPEVYFARSADGSLQSSSRAATITRNARGRWTVAFSSPHPDGVDYHPSLTPEEQLSNRDSVDIQVIEGTQTANGFQIMMTTGDNGGAGDTFVDAPWSFSVTAPVTVVTGLNLSTP